MESNASTRFSVFVNQINDLGTVTAKDFKYFEQLFQDLTEEAPKRIETDVIAKLPLEKLILFVNVLQETVNSGISSAVLDNECSEDGDHKRQTQSIHAIPAINAAFLVVNIMLSTDKFKESYLQNVLEKLIFFLNCQLNECVIPFWRTKGNQKRSRSQNKDKNIPLVYEKIVKIVSLLTELVTRNALIQSSHILVEIFNLCLSIFLLEKSYETKHPSLQLLTSVFIHCQNYPKHLFHVILKALDDPMKSIFLLDKCELRPGSKIQVVTLLFLHLLHCVAQFPSRIDKIKLAHLNWDTFISEKCKLAHNLAADIVHELCLKCASKKNISANSDYETVVENVVQDLLQLTSSAEWPAAELMLSCLANSFVSFITSKHLDQTLLASFLNYLGLLLLKSLENSTVIRDSNVNVLVDGYCGGNTSKDIDNDRYYVAQLMIIDNLATKLPSEMSIMHAYLFHIFQCYENVASFTTQPTDNLVTENNKRKHKDSDEEDVSRIEKLRVKKSGKANKAVCIPNSKVKMNSSDKKTFLIDKLETLCQLRKIDNKCYEVDHELIMKYITTMKPFAQKFECYLKIVLKVLVSNCGVQLRTRAIKCISMLVTADPAVLGYSIVHKCVNSCFLDASIAVREAAVDLMGTHMLRWPQLIDDYYDMISARILDTGISVRKRVIQIFQYICSQYPGFSKIIEIYCKIMRRLNDEIGIQTQVISMFQNVWFTPVSASDSTVFLEKVRNMVHVIDQLNNDQLFEKLLLSIFTTRESSDDSKVDNTSKSVLKACEQIVDNLAGNMINRNNLSIKDALCVLPSLKILCAFAKVKTELLVKHIVDFKSYLTDTSKVHGEKENQIIIYITHILELVVPTLKNPNVEFIKELEIELTSISIFPDLAVVKRSVSCLASIVTKISHNYSLIRDMLKKCHTVLLHVMQKASQTDLKTYELQHSLYMVGLLLRYFDFSDKDIIGDEIPGNIQELILKSCLFFAHAQDESVKTHALNAIGLVCVRCSNFLLNSEIQALYTGTLRNNQTFVTVKVKILNNLELYLGEDEKQIAKNEAELSNVAERNIKEVDMTSSMASTVIQLYLKTILDCYLDPNETVRFAVCSVLKRVLDQGLIHPAQIVPTLISMSTEDRLRDYANDQLKLIELKYPGFIHMKAMLGIQLSYQLQKKLTKQNSVVRGFDETKGWPKALHGFLFINFRNQLQRRAFLTSVLKIFQESNTSLAEMLYLADNVAHLPFSVLDELLFVVNTINNMLALVGNNVLETFQQALLPHITTCNDPMTTSDDEEDESEKELMARIPKDMSFFKDFVSGVYGCLLLLSLKNHLKSCYGLTDAMFSKYTQSTSNKLFDKKVCLKRRLRFSPKTTIKRIQCVDEVYEPHHLIVIYLELKRLMIDVDSKEE